MQAKFQNITIYFILKPIENGMHVKHHLHENTTDDHISTFMGSHLIIDLLFGDFSLIVDINLFMSLIILDLCIFSAFLF